MVYAQNETSRTYVKVGAQGDGSSWQSPTSDLKKALSEAYPGQEIWVAAGTYFPSKTNDRTQSFVIPEGVKLIGGFAGHEISIDERNIDANISILSGEIGTVGHQDNSYTILYTKGVSNATQIDGFTISGANANLQAKEASPFSSGGGWYNQAKGLTSSPVVRNCTFKNNRAFFGAGFYNNAEGGRSDLMIDACTFVGNIAKFDGGAILNNGSNGSSNISIIYSAFKSNEAYYGAGILNKAEIAGEASPYIKNVRFEKNLAYMKGSPIYNLRSIEGTSAPTMISCVSIGNQESVRTPESSSIQINSDKKTQTKRTITISSSF